MIKNEIGQNRFDEVQDSDELEKRFRLFFQNEKSNHKYPR